MKTQNETQKWEQAQANYFNSAVGYYQLSLLDEAEAELNKMDTCAAAQSVSVLELRLAISYCRSDWNEMKAIARRLFLLDPSNPQWPFSDGYATGKIESTSDAEH